MEQDSPERYEVIHHAIHTQKVLKISHIIGFAVPVTAVLMGVALPLWMYDVTSYDFLKQHVLPSYCL